MYALPLPELTLHSDFKEKLRQNIWSLPDAAWTTTPSGLTEWAHVTGTELQMFQNKFAPEADKLITGYRYFRIPPKTTIPTHMDKTRNALIFFSLNPEIDHTLRFKNGRHGDTMLTLKYSDAPTLIDVKRWHEAVNNSLEYRMAVIVSIGWGQHGGTFSEIEELYKNEKLLCCQDQPDYEFPWLKGLDRWEGHLDD